MKRKTTRISCFILLVLLMIFHNKVSIADELTVYIWEEYISEQVIKKFTEKTGITIKQVYFDSDQHRDEVMASAGGAKFDIVLFDSIAAQIFGKNDYLLGISGSAIPNLKHIDTQWKESCGNFGVPYFYGTTGILYNKTKFTRPPESWEDLLMPASQHKGHVSMIKDMSDTLVAPLIYLGYNINSEKENELKAAYEILLKQSVDVLSYDYAMTTVQNNDPEKTIHMALGFSGDQYALNEETETEDWAYVIPKEGTALWMDCLSVPSQSKNKENALAFINFLTSPEIAAENTEEIYCPTPVGAARKLLPEEVAEDEELFPPKEKLDNYQMHRILSDKNLHFRRRMLDSLVKRNEAQ